MSRITGYNPGTPISRGRGVGDYEQPVLSTLSWLFEQDRQTMEDTKIVLFPHQVELLEELGDAKD